MDVLKIIAVVLMFALALVLAIYNFLNQSKEDRINSVINFLLAEVYKAEEMFGSGTGSLKLAVVYNSAIKVFPWIAKKYTLEEFDELLVKPSLEWLANQMENNPNIRKLLGL